jgi:hypothetical protein
VTLVAVSGHRSFRPSLIGAVLLLFGGVVLDYVALSTTPGGFGTRFPHNASGRDAQFDSLGGSELERAVWLTTVAAALAFTAAALIAFWAEAPSQNNVASGRRPGSRLRPTTGLDPTSR